jgi:hypothetical protein
MSLSIIGGVSLITLGITTAGFGRWIIKNRNITNTKNISDTIYTIFLLGVETLGLITCMLQHMSNVYNMFKNK